MSLMPLRALPLIACLALPLVADAVPTWRAWQGGATPPLALKDLSGMPRTLADFKDKVVVINFWATWCEPCIEEMPALDRLRERFADRGLEVVGINLGEGPARIEAWLNKLGVRMPILLDRDETAKRDWKVRGVPTTFLVGRDGKIRWTLFGQVDFTEPHIEKRIAALLNAPRPRATSHASAATAANR